jgi:phosphopantetheine--protein transferase-like protein
MTMEAKVKEIVSNFTKTPSEALQAHTRIDRTAFRNSITLHRMYATLEREGLKVDDPTNIATMGDLLARLGQPMSAAAAAPVPAQRPVAAPAASAAPTQVAPVTEGTVRTVATEVSMAVGIDIQAVAELPETADFREHAFYQQTFAGSEIAHCLLKPSPRESFAGLFAAKEAIIKADGRHRATPFSQLVISFDEQGKPLFDGMNLSISHSGETAVAVAVVMPQIHISLPEPAPAPAPVVAPQLPFQEQDVKAWIKEATDKVDQRQKLLKAGKTTQRIAGLALLVGVFAAALAGLALLIV